VTATVSVDRIYAITCATPGCDATLTGTYPAWIFETRDDRYPPTPGEWDRTRLRHEHATADGWHTTRNADTHYCPTHAPAQRITEAINLIRDIASKATPGPWGGYNLDDGRCEIFGGPYENSYPTGTVIKYEDYRPDTDSAWGCDDCIRPSDADHNHITRWHPETARAVADLLEATTALEPALRDLADRVARHVLDLIDPDGA
jgi:hypothetical protein